MSSGDCLLRERYGSCVGQPVYEDKEDRYCVLHFPGDDKKEDFKRALYEKLANGDLNFAGAVFPSSTEPFIDHYYAFIRAGRVEANFSETTFKGYAVFSEITEMGWSSFPFAGEANFSKATFEEGATFAGTYFDGGADFSDAIFKKEADFLDTHFERQAHFSNAL